MTAYRSVALAGIIAVAAPVFSQETQTNAPAGNASRALAPREAGGPEREIIVSASRDRRDANQIPANVTVITPADIQAAESVSVVDVIKHLDGIYFRSFSGNDAQAEISLRGFGENSHGRVLILLDGQRLNRPDMAGINWSQIPLNNVERIEILRGSQSALYGDHAVGGVINIITQKGTRRPEAAASALAGSYGLNVQRLSASGTTGALALSAQAERNQADGYRRRSAYLSWGGNGSAGYDLNEWNHLSLATVYNKLDYQLPGGLSKAQMKADPRQSLSPNDRARNRYFNANAGWNSVWTDLGIFDLNASFDRKTIASDMDSWSSFADVTINSPGITPRFTLERDLFNRPNKFLVGVDGYWDRLESERFSDSRRQNRATTATIDKQTLGGYVRDDFQIHELLILGAGARQEQARIAANVSSSGTNAIDDAVTHNANALEVSLTAPIAPQSKVFTRAGTAYRFPFVDEQVQYIGYSTDKMYNDLKTEKGQNYEVGTQLELGLNITAGLTLFLLNMQNEIAYNGTTFRNENLDATRRTGAETFAAWGIGDYFSLDVNYTLTDARFTAGDNDGHTVPLAPKHHAAVTPKLFLPWDISLNAVLAYAGTQYLGGDNANSGDKLSDYTTVDLALRYTPQVKRLNLEAFVGIDNIFDEQYASVGYRGWAADSYYPSPGRTYKAGLAAKF